jgi:plastocyanin
MDPSVDYMTYDESEGIVGNGGGEITLNDPVSSLSGAVVNIPQGALDSEQKIRISIDNSVIPNSSLTSDIIKFEPSGLVFNKPVTIRLPVDNKVAGSSRLFYFQPDSGIVRQIPLTFSGGDFLEAEIAHFSRYFVTEKEYAFFDATLYNTDNTIKARIKFGGTYGLSSIPITKFNSIKSFFLANSLITNAKQVIDECTFYYDLGTREAPEACYATIRVDLKEGNWLYSRKLKSIKLAVQRKGKDLSKPTWAEIKMVEPESRILFTTTPLDSEERELFFSGQALMFDFGIKAENNKKYFLEISWCLSDNSHAYLDGIRYTSVYEVNSYDDYPAWTTENMSRFDPDVNGDFIHDAVAESVNGPNANFTAEQRTVTAGGSVQFTDQSANNPTVWSWNFGDGHTSSLPSPAHTYSTAGVYTVILTVSNSFGSDGETKTGYITVNPAGSAPVANFTGDPRTITAGGSVQFTDQSTNNPTI